MGGVGLAWTALLAGGLPTAALLAAIAPEAVVEALPATDSLYAAGVRALEEGLPQVAVYKLRAFLQTAPAAEARGKAVLALARALLQVRDATGALATLNAEYPTPAAAGPDASFWFGQVYAALKRWPEALASYSPAAAAKSVPPALQAAARFGQAEALLALERTADAAAAFKRLIDDPRFGEPARLRCAEIALDTRHLKDATAFLLGATPAGVSEAPRNRNPYAAKEHAYLLGRLRLATGQPDLAEEMFKAALADPDGLSERLLAVSYWGWAKACLDQKHLEQAEDALEFLIDKHPHDPYQPQTFSWLEELYRDDPAPDLSELRRWAADAEQPEREAYACLALGRLETHAGRTDRAEEILSGFGESFPNHPLRLQALFDLAALQLRLGRLAQAHATVAAARALERAPLSTAAATAAAATTGEPSPPPPPPDDLPVQLEALDARISLAENDSATAARRFEAVSHRTEAGAQAEAAAFDAVLGWLRAMDGANLAAAEEEFRQRFPQSNLNAEFLLEEGLARAGQTSAGDSAARQSAAACLRQFLREQPASPRAAEARVALAELAFDRARPNVPVAEREINAPELRLVANAGGGAAEQERASYLAIWLADAPGPKQDEDKAVALAKQFLQEHPDSSLALEARMKLAEIYFGREDYPDAQTQLELLADGAPNSALAEPALYLAGLAAARSMSPAGLDKAVTLFAAAAHRDGPLKLAAGLQQAEVQKRLGKAQDALTLYDGVLTATADRPLNAAELESRCAALSGRGETLFAQASEQPSLYSEAAKTFQQLAQTPGASLLWRRQALTQQGGALEKLGDSAAALAAYDDAMNAAAPPSAAAPEPEWVWFYRAGQNAARLLEAQSQWSAAIAIYKKLAASDGPLKSEFENTLTRLRLEHFIWEE